VNLNDLTPKGLFKKMVVPVLRWLLSGLIGKIIISAVMQGVIVAASLFYAGEIATWATGKIIQFVRNSQLWERLSLAFSGLGDLPAYSIQFMSCIGAHEILVVLIAGQISGIGVALICRTLLEEKRK
jgi:hypothetical protein